MTKTLLGALALVGMAVLLTGCDTNAGKAPGRVAIVDLDKVAKELGWMDEIGRSIESFNQTQGAKLNAFIAERKKAIDEAEAKAGATPSKEDKEKIDTLKMVANREIQTAYAQLQQEANQTRFRVIAGYRDDIKPVAKKIATAEGMSAVLVPMDGVLWYDQGIDITSKVVDELLIKKIPSRTTMVPYPVNVGGPTATQPAPAPAPAPVPK